MPKTTPQQEPFSVAVRIALIREGMTITQLARHIGVSRTAVSQAIHHNLHRPTRAKIARHLKIKLAA